MRVQDVADVRGLGGGNLGAAVARQAPVPDGRVQSRHQGPGAADQRAAREQGELSTSPFPSTTPHSPTHSRTVGPRENVQLAP